MSLLLVENILKVLENAGLDKETLDIVDSMLDDLIDRVRDDAYLDATYYRE